MSLMTKLPAIIEAYKLELARLCMRHGVVTLALFGSALRDDFDPDRSDLDFAVAFADMTPVEHKRAFFGLLEDLESLFGRRVDLIEVGAVRNPFVRAGIEATQEPLYAAPG